jgi:threonylcarbamoyladenosine tRNA methylthiotransferase CDKAL1
VKCRDHAYRQVVVQNAPAYGLEPGDSVDVEVTGHNTVYALGEPV